MSYPSASDNSSWLGINKLAPVGNKTTLEKISDKLPAQD